MAVTTYARWYGAQARVFSLPREAGQDILYYDHFYYETGGLTWRRAIHYAGPSALGADVIVLNSGPIHDTSELAAEAFNERNLTIDDATAFVADLRSLGYRDPTVLTLSLPSSGAPVLRTLFQGPHEPDSTSLLYALRNAEFCGQLEWSGAVLSLRNAHFELPAGNHADKFIRSGELFNEIEFVGRASDWLGIHLVPGTIMLADTPSMNPLLLELRRRAMALGHPRPSIGSFTRYPSLDEVRLLVDKLLTSQAEVRKLLFVLSVASSDQLLTNLRRYVGESLPSGVQFVPVIVVDTRVDPRDDADVMLRYTRIKRFDIHKGQECLLCDDAEHASVVTIDPVRYFPIVRPSVREAMITPPVASEHRNLWEAATRTDAVKVHWDSPDANSRHLPVWFDVSRLLRDPEFKRSTLAQLRKEVPLCDVVLIPRHPASEELAKLAIMAYGPLEPIIVDEQDVRGVYEKLTHLPAGTRNILILDDAVILGKTMRRLHRLIQEALASGDSRAHPSYEVNAFAVLGRTDSKDRWDRLVNAFRQDSKRAHLASAISLHTLDSFDDCPWCKEQRLLQAHRRALLDPKNEPSINQFLQSRAGAPVTLADVAEAIETRLSHLQSPGGLNRGLYFCDHAGDMDYSAPSRISRHSLFGEQISETAAYAGVASAMQHIRQSQKDPEERLAWNVPKILTAYHDPLLAAAFLRGAEPKETNVVHPATNFARGVAEASFTVPGITASFLSSKMLATEILLACYLGIIPGRQHPSIKQEVGSVLIDASKRVRAIAAALEWSNNHV